MNQFTSNLAGKTIAIVGGSGYTGMAITQKAINLGIKVLSISRTGEPHYNKNLRNDNLIQFIKGNALYDFQSMIPYFQQADLVVHTIGTLIEGKGDNTYEKMNKQAAINIAQLLQQIGEQQNRRINMVYLSASKHPPFLPRYLSTKVEVEQFMLSQNNIRSIILKPGFIYSKDGKPWSVALKPVLQIYNTVTSPIVKMTENTMLGCLTKHIDVDTAVSLDDVAYSAIVAGLDLSFQKTHIYNQDMLQITKSFINNNYNIAS